MSDDERLACALIINGVDVTAHLDVESAPPTITSELNATLDTLEATLKEADALDLTGWDEVVLNDTSGGGAVPLFGGYLLTKKQSADTNLTKNRVETGSSDYGAYLAKVYFTGEFNDGTTDIAILAAVFAACPELSGYDATSFTVSLRTLPRVVFNSKSVQDIIAWIVEQTGANWYVDYAKKLHYFGAEEYFAPFGITTNPLDTANCLAENVVVNEEADGVVNVVELIGGNSLSANETVNFTQIGLNALLTMNKKFKPWDGASEIAVRRNDGGATTNMIVNPSFESNITDGWTQLQAGSAAVWAQDSMKYKYGTKCAKITAGTAMAMLYCATLSLAPGEALSVQVMAYAATLGLVSIAIYDTVNLVTLAETVNRKTGSWEQLTATYINSGATTLSVRVELRNKATDSSTAAYFDGAQAEKSAWPTAYCDGSLGTGYAWSGTANNSTSTRVNMPIWTTLNVISGSEVLSSRSDVYYFESTGKLQQENYWPTLADAIQVDGREETPVHVMARNYDSYQFYGKWFKQVINDNTISDPIVGRIRCATELAQYAMATQTITLDVRRRGLRAGQTMTINLPVRHISGDFLIQRVSTVIGIGGHFVASVSLGAVGNDLIKWMLALKKVTTVTDNEVNSDDVINRILDFTDVVEVDDAGGTVSHSQGPYLWGTAPWGFSRWG
jgi:Carbohydrate binding domain.